MGPEWTALRGVEAKAIVQSFVCRIGGNILRGDGLDDMLNSLHQIAKLSDGDLDKLAQVDNTPLNASVHAM